MALGGVTEAVEVVVRGARVPSSEHASGLAASVARVVDDVPASQATEGVAQLDTASTRFVERSAEELTAKDWDDFATALADDPLGVTLTGPRTIYDAPELRLVVDAIRLGDRSAVPVADRYFHAWRTAGTGPTAIKERSVELLQRWWDDSLEPEQWRELRGIVDADQTGELTGMAPKFGYSPSSLRTDIIERAGGAVGEVDPSADGYFLIWAREHDPRHGERVRASMDEVLHGTPTWRDQQVLRVEKDRLDQITDLLPDPSSAEQRKIARFMTNGGNDPYFPWLQQDEATYAALLDDAIETVATGREVHGDHRVLLGSAGRAIEGRIAARPIEERVRVMAHALPHAERSDWLRANDPSWIAKLDDALDAVIAGDPAWEHTRLLRDEGEHLDAVLARRPFEQQRAYKLIEHEHLPGAVARWDREHAPDWPARLDAAVEDVAGGAPSDYSKAALRLESRRARTLLAGRPYEAQERIARAAMQPDTFADWRLANDPVHRANVRAGIDRIIAGEAPLAEHADALAAEARRLDDLLDEHPAQFREAIARASLGATTREFAEWMSHNDPDRPATLRAAADAAVAGTLDAEQMTTLSHLGADLGQVLAGRSLPDRMRILWAVKMRVNGGIWSELRAAQEPELRAWQRRAVDEASRGELSDDARIVLRDEHRKLDELVDGAEYEAKLRVAEAAYLMPNWLQQWKAATDPRRVERVAESANRIADGVATPHDLRVLFGEVDVLGVVRDRPYAEQLRVARVAFTDGGLRLWVRNNDPEYLRQMASTIDELVAGRGTAEHVQRLRDDRANTFRLLADRPPADRGTIAVAMLGASDRGFDGEIAAMRELALDARRRLDALPAIPELDELRATTDDMLDRNVQRMTGMIGDDPNRGYAIHPDYAELGRVQANLDLFEAVAGGRTSAATADDVLSW